MTPLSRFPRHLSTGELPGLSVASIASTHASSSPLESSLSPADAGEASLRALLPAFAPWRAELRSAGKATDGGERERERARERRTATDLTERRAGSEGWSPGNRGAALLARTRAVWACTRCDRNVGVGEADADGVEKGEMMVGCARAHAPTNADTARCAGVRGGEVGGGEGGGEAGGGVGGEPPTAGWTALPQLSVLLQLLLRALARGVPGGLSSTLMRDRLATRGAKCASAASSPPPPPSRAGPALRHARDTASVCEP